MLQVCQPRLLATGCRKSACSSTTASALYKVRRAPTQRLCSSPPPARLHQLQRLSAAEAPAAAAPTLAEQARLKLSGQDGEAWDSCVAAVREAAGLDHVEATRCIAKAYGWLISGFWRQGKKDEVPNAEQVGDVLGLLAELGIQDADLAKYLQRFPEVLACDADELLRSNVHKLAETYKMQGEVLAKALMRQPQVLGFNVDCDGNCIGECNRCWVRF